MSLPDHETEVLEALRKTGGFFTTYWQHETQYRAAAIERLEARGVLIDDTKLPFPRRHVRIEA